MKSIKRKISLLLVIVMIFSSAIASAATGDMWTVSDNKLFKTVDEILQDDTLIDLILQNTSDYGFESKNGKVYFFEDVIKAYELDEDYFLNILETRYTPIGSVKPPVDYEYLSLKSVKDGYLNRHYYSSVGEAFENYFYYPQWEYFYSADNSHIVEFIGDVTLDGVYGTVIMQFAVDHKENRFEIVYCEFNNKSMWGSEITQLLDMIYITKDYIPYNINILPPNNIGTVWMEATYTNLTSHPITRFSVKVHYKDTNTTGYLSNYDTVMPGDTSPIFDTFGPSSMKLEDVDILTIDIRVELPDNMYLRMDYDAKLGRYNYRWYDY